MHWDKVNYLGFKKNDTNLWKEIKLIRKLISKKFVLNNKHTISLEYGVNDFLQQKLHYLDFNFGAGLQK